MNRLKLCQKKPKRIGAAVGGQAALPSQQSAPPVVQTGPAGVMGAMGRPALGCTAASLPVPVTPPLMGLTPHAVPTAAGCACDVKRGLASRPPAVGLECPRASRVALGAAVWALQARRRAGPSLVGFGLSRLWVGAQGWASPRVLNGMS